MLHTAPTICGSLKLAWKAKLRVKSVHKRLIVAFLSFVHIWFRFALQFWSFCPLYPQFFTFLPHTHTRTLSCSDSPIRLCFSLLHAPVSHQAPLPWLKHIQRYQYSPGIQLYGLMRHKLMYIQRWYIQRWCLKVRLQIVIDSKDLSQNIKYDFYYHIQILLNP